MTVQELIDRLSPVAEIAPDTLVLIGRGEDSWYDEVGDIGICRINRHHDGLNCGLPRMDDAGTQEVLVIH